jgi:NAD(P)-dependent dehydrogenase (short-subunit alcohol dehydrogenase family)
MACLTTGSCGEAESSSWYAACTPPRTMKNLPARALSGLLAGLLATGAMTLVMAVGKKVGALGEPPPRRITRRMLTFLGPLRPHDEALNVTAWAAHLGFGASLGIAYSLLPVRTSGASFGALVWVANYAGWLPRTGLMPSPTRDRPGRPTTMLAAHLVFGAALARAYRSLRRPSAPLRGRVAVVCGGSRGLGRSIARELLLQGASVAICGRDPRSLEDTRAWLEGFGGRVVAHACDLQSEAQTLDFFASVTQRLGSIDVVVANAATLLVAPLETLTPFDFDKAQREIFGTAMRAALLALPGMRAGGRGNLVFISSVGGKVGVPHLAPYSAAKFAIAGFAEAVGAEVAKDGVRVLTVFPGLMRTGSHAHASYQGHPERELGWFAAAAIAPLLSIDADRAARHVVRALVDGRTRLSFTPAARLAMLAHDLLPGVWSGATAVAARLLPRAPSNGAAPERREGVELLHRSSSPLLRLIGERTARLAARHNQ